MNAVPTMIAGFIHNARTYQALTNVSAKKDTREKANFAKVSFIYLLVEFNVGHNFAIFSASKGY